MSKSYIEAGMYTATIDKMELTEDAQGREVVTWHLTVVGGPHDGETLQKRFYTDYEKVREFLKKELRLLGLDIKNAKDYEARKAETYGKRVEIEVVINDEGYPVCYLKGLASSKPKTNRKNKSYSW